MRSRVRDRQIVYLTKLTETRSGIDLVYSYSRPVKHMVTVSRTGGIPAEIYPGIVPDYDRFITAYDGTFSPEEGDLLYVDVSPELDENGDLVLSDGIPTVKPDYRVIREIGTAKSCIWRFGIKKNG